MIITIYILSFHKGNNHQKLQTICLLYVKKRLKNNYISHLLLLRFLIQPEVDVGAEETKLGEGGEDQQDRLDFPVESNTLHPMKQQEQLSEVLNM